MSRVSAGGGAATNLGAADRPTRCPHLSRRVSACHRARQGRAGTSPSSVSQSSESPIRRRPSGLCCSPFRSPFYGY